jgi:hypothetical protein
MAFKVPENYRMREGFGQFNSTELDGNNGCFIFRYAGRKFFCIVSDGLGWEHVSVSLKDRCPTWEEMCMIKDLFWDEDDCVAQFHPPKSEYVNNHPYCLHLWRSKESDFSLPPKIMVGV